MMKLSSLLLVLLSPLAVAQAEFIPKPGFFAPADAGHYYAGELVSIDHVNRRGGLRLDGDGNSARYQAAPTHFFSLLPYATLRYQGATADLVHIPLGTHLHGTFVLPPEGDTSIPKPRKDEEKWVPVHNHVLLLEDDVSFYQRRGQAWEVDSVDAEKKALTATLTGPDLPGGLKGKKTFSIDGSTRIWKGNGFGAIADIQPGQSVDQPRVASGMGVHRLPPGGRLAGCGEPEAGSQTPERTPQAARGAPLASRLDRPRGASAGCKGHHHLHPFRRAGSGDV